MKPTVGQEVIVINGSSGDVNRGIVTKLARKYFTVEYHSQAGSIRPWVVEFAIATGRQRNENPNYPQNHPHYAYTQEAYEAKLQRDELDKRADVYRLFSFGSPFEFRGPRLSNEALEAILNILDAELDRLTNE